MLGDARAEDAAQQTMLLAYTAIVGGTRVDALGPWLHGIARNVCLDVLRANGSSWELLSEDLRSSDDPAVVAERSETLARLAAALADLPQTQRSALLMRELEGRSHAEIGARLGVSAGAARQLVHRARNAARATIQVLVPPELIARVATVAVHDTPAAAGTALGKAGAAALLSAVIAGSATFPQAVPERSERLRPESGGAAAASALPPSARRHEPGPRAGSRPHSAAPRRTRDGLGTGGGETSRPLSNPEKAAPERKPEPAAVRVEQVGQHDGPAGQAGEHSQQDTGESRHDAQPEDAGSASNTRAREAEGESQTGDRGGDNSGTGPGSGGGAAE